MHLLHPSAPFYRIVHDSQCSFCHVRNIPMLWKLSVTTIIFIKLCSQTVFTQGSKCDILQIKDLDAAELSAL
jgi:hypothetical protein